MPITSLAITRHHRNAILFHHRLRHANYSVLVVQDRFPFSVTSSPRPLAARLLSSSTPPSTTPKSTDGVLEPPPSPSITARKHKIELRPGPIKTQKTPLPVTDVAPASSSPPAPQSPAPAKTESLVETTKHDMEDASQHGILAPPPADASWAGKLWHQAKELFKFYWRGIKLIASNRRRVRTIEARVRAGGAPLSRWETKFIQTNHRDMLK
ncbi:uncharacterized protein FIBRA_02735 [Fibroporia radiculosa]|uniref:Uncharacterized protein n=1 Tax=Fibroporia radiculosa TaxID=599839 RepID=J4I980_9APHY|nr:uncharacterized protein FIBRA_02735 [Fibroporia radiculosa]CCM00696.1 predicted protein [Fibroporia radiculosa]